MSKNTAKSKGYRKSAAKKPYLTKRELIVFAVLLVLIAIGALVFTLLTDDGALKVVDGKVVTQGENSLIAADTTSGSARYFKVGQVAEVDGYELSARPLESDANLVEYSYTPTGDALLDEVRFSAYSSDASLLAISTQLTYEAAETECSQLMEVGDQHRVVRYFTCVSDASDDPDAAFDRVQALNAYIPAGEHCIVIHLFHRPLDGEDLLTDEALVDALLPFLDALSFETE